MKITIHPSNIKGHIEAPSSKSLTQRAIAAGLLAKGVITIRNPSFCNDSLAAIEIARALGASVTTDRDTIKVKSGLVPSSAVTLNCGESGLSLRMFSPVATLISDHVTFTGEGSLLNRPVTMISDALLQLGIKAETDNGRLPVTLKGRLRGGRAVIDGSTGSQLLTGLLMALPLADSDSEIKVLNLRSKPYISLTLDLMSWFGVRVKNDDFRHFIIPGGQSYTAREYTVEGDWSGAAFLLVAGAVAGEVAITNLSCGSAQADRAVMQVLHDAGCRTGEVGRVDEAGGAINTFRSSLKAFTFDATDSPDLFPPLAALAAYCNGTSVIGGAGRLIHKESNRAGAIMEVLAAMNIRSHVEGDEMLIEGGKVHGAVVSSHNDHRIAMMAAVMALGSNGPVTITGAEAVAKSFPEFYDLLASLGGRLSGLI